MKLFFTENKKILLSYMLFMLIVWVTFKLHTVNLEVFWDVFLFTFTVFLIGIIINFYKVYQSHLALIRLKKKEQLTRLDVTDIKQTPNILLNDYKKLLFTQTIKNIELSNHNQQKLQELEEYYGLWSHQVKIPLAALTVLNQASQPDTSKIKIELLKIDDYLNMMLHYLKFNQLGKDLVLSKVDVASLVKEVIKHFSPFFIQKNLSVKMSDITLTSMTDAKWLRFILEQLIFNGIKYTQKGGLKIYQVNRSLMIEDTGIGILAEDLPRIFESGYTGFNGRQHHKATGLGLHMSQKVALELGIHVTIFSELGSGTRVELKFPESNESNQST